MAFTNITSADLVNKGVTGLPDTPGFTTEEMQERFDSYSVLLKDKFNNHIEELEADTAAADIGAEVPESLPEGTGHKVQDILNAMESGIASHKASTDNPHSVTKAQVGLGNVPNVDTDDQTPTVTEAEAFTNLATGDDLKTIVGKVKKAITTLSAHLVNTSNPHSVTKAQVGLGNCDNTADLSKPISTATQTALDGKAPTSHAVNTDTYGKSSASLFGHTKLTDDFNQETPPAASDGVAASPKALKAQLAYVLNVIQEAGWGDMLREIYDPDRDGVIAPAQGGTGKSTNTANSVLVGNGTSAVKNIASASGAFYATSANGEPVFGTLPVAQGGTGATDAAGARTNLSVPSTTELATAEANAESMIAPVEPNATSTRAYTTGQKLVWNGLLYKAKSSISIGDTFTVGTNIELSEDVSTSLATLNTQLTAQIVPYTVGENVTDLRANIIKIGNLIIGNVTFVGTITGTNDPILTIDSGYRPSNAQQASGIIIKSSSRDLGYYRVNGNGTLVQGATSQSIESGTASFAYYIGEA